MGRSPGFGSLYCYYVARLRLAFAAASGLLALNLAAVHNSLVRSTKSTRPPVYSRAATACKHRVSGSVSLPFRGSFHLSLTVLVHYRSPRVFSLGRWASLLPTGLACPVVLKVTSRSLASFRLRGSHPLCPAFPGSLTMNQICNFLDVTSSSSRALQPPHDIGAGPLSRAGLGCSPFARHYSGNDLSSSGY